MSHEVYYINFSLSSDSMSVGREKELYIYTSVGLSALLVSTYRAMREPLDWKRVASWLYAFLFVFLQELNRLRWLCHETRYHLTSFINLLK